DWSPTRSTGWCARSVRTCPPCPDTAGLRRDEWPRGSERHVRLPRRRRPTDPAVLADAGTHPSLAFRLRDDLAGGGGADRGAAHRSGTRAPLDPGRVRGAGLGGRAGLAYRTAAGRPAYPAVRPARRRTRHGARVAVAA